MSRPLAGTGSRFSILFHRNSLCIIATFVLCSSLLFSSLVVAKPSLRISQSPSRQGRPEAGPPAANLPNLDDARRKQHSKPKAPAQDPSTLRSRRKPQVARKGRKVGDSLPSVSMSDGLGSCDYTYDQLSRMTSETRYIADLGYGRSLCSQLPVQSIERTDQYHRCLPTTMRGGSAKRTRTVVHGVRVQTSSTLILINKAFGYDAWNHSTSRSGLLYNQGLSDGGSYTNNRRSGWDYDADGNNTKDASYSQTFNGAGKTECLLAETGIPGLGSDSLYSAPGTQCQQKTESRGKTQASTSDDGNMLLSL
jgi:hypothetical protein